MPHSGVFLFTKFYVYGAKDTFIALKDSDLGHSETDPIRCY